MKTLSLIGLLILALLVFGGPQDFLDTAVDCTAGATVLNGTHFTSREIGVSMSISRIFVTFTRAAGSSSTVDFYFQISPDGGITWTTAYFRKVSVQTDEAAVGNVVRFTDRDPIGLYGVSHIRLWKIVNNDVSNALTACNAGISLK